MAQENPTTEKSRSTPLITSDDVRSVIDAPSASVLPNPAASSDDEASPGVSKVEGQPGFSLKPVATLSPDSLRGTEVAIEPKSASVPGESIQSSGGKDSAALQGGATISPESQPTNPKQKKKRKAWPIGLRLLTGAVAFGGAIADGVLYVNQHPDQAPDQFFAFRQSILSVPGGGTCDSRVLAWHIQSHPVTNPDEDRHMVIEKRVDDEWVPVGEFNISGSPVSSGWGIECNVSEDDIRHRTEVRSEDKE